MMVRGLRGVDPEHGAVLVGPEIREGLRMAYAVRDGRAAREDLDAVLRELERDIAGAAPRFGIYVSCAGRGMGLHGTPDVETRALRGRFPALPFAGMFSSYEVAPHGGFPTLQLYAGVLALFTAPS